MNVFSKHTNTQTNNVKEPNFVLDVDMTVPQSKKGNDPEFKVVQLPDFRIEQTGGKDPRFEMVEKNELLKIDIPDKGENPFQTENGKAEELIVDSAKQDPYCEISSKSNWIITGIGLILLILICIYMTSKTETINSLPATSGIQTTK